MAVRSSERRQSYVILPVATGYHDFEKYVRYNIYISFCFSSVSMVSHIALSLCSHFLVTFAWENNQADIPRSLDLAIAFQEILTSLNRTS